ncbi:gp46 [Bacillus phage SPO1]|uniref:Inhibitor of histone-like protein HU n=1 Tax=Bacillus phage SP01 TaxID=2884427 RepID=GP46_BPSP1|nr:gp46 [Bacillus phage SPO1]O48400.1 RecName: Full=Inhibitor of histone-like protein HU; AltName: Full=Gene 46 protein; Short=Gp46; AltName: Full=Gene product 46 [Bacillus phage SPO1]AAC29015.1 unknown [Bacillus phage SPO1]ACI90919.1 gp46 [Bacillus phage SPO1]7BY7_A Chain A, Putative gene 46 protein [Okubovirus SPO1]
MMTEDQKFKYLTKIEELEAGCFSDWTKEDITGDLKYLKKGIIEESIELIRAVNGLTYSEELHDFTQEIIEELDISPL